jgi:hypothetical protein
LRSFPPEQRLLSFRPISALTVVPPDQRLPSS